MRLALDGSFNIEGIFPLHETRESIPYIQPQTHFTPRRAPGNHNNDLPLLEDLELPNFLTNPPNTPRFTVSYPCFLYEPKGPLRAMNNDVSTFMQLSIDAE